MILNPFLNSLSYVEDVNLTLTSIIREEYVAIFVYIIFSGVLGSIIIILSYLLVNQNPESEKLSTYECGFEPYEDSRNKFNIKFYTVAILFLLFDIEIIFILPWCLHLSQLNILSFWTMVEFLVELVVGYVYIWTVGAIEWK